jgi:hypothetical protein
LTRNGDREFELDARDSAGELPLVDLFVEEPPELIMDLEDVAHDLKGQFLELVLRHAPDWMTGRDGHGGL